MHLPRRGPARAFLRIKRILFFLQMMAEELRTRISELADALSAQKKLEDALEQQKRLTDRWRPQEMSTCWWLLARIEATAADGVKELVESIADVYSSTRTVGVDSDSHKFLLRHALATQSSPPSYRRCCYHTPVAASVGLGTHGSCAW